MTTQQALAVIRLLIVVAALWVILRNRCTPQNLIYSLPYVFWLAHAGVYLVGYLALSATGKVNPVAFNVWGAAMQIQGFLTVLMVEVARWHRQRRKQGANSGC